MLGLRNVSRTIASQHVVLLLCYPPASRTERRAKQAFFLDASESPLSIRDVECVRCLMLGRGALHMRCISFDRNSLKCINGCVCARVHAGIGPLIARRRHVKITSRNTAESPHRHTSDGPSNRAVLQ